MAVSERTFGVEIECGHPKLRYGEVASRLQITKPFAGKGYSVGSDGSGIEVRTPILKGDEGFAELHEIMDFLNDLGCYVARNDGMHVHIGAEGFNEDEEACKVLMRTWYHNQQYIERMVSSHRAGAYVCSKVNKADADKSGQYTHPPKEREGPYGHKGKYWGPRMLSMGLSSVPRRGTIECRLHEGCLDPVKAEAWVKFVQAMLDHAIEKREVLRCTSKISLLRKLSVPEDAIEVLRKRQPTMSPELVTVGRPAW